MRRYVFLVMVLGVCLAGCKPQVKQAEQSNFVIEAAAVGNASNMEPAEVLNLYDGPAPGTENWTHHESKMGESGEVLFNVSEPTLAVYLPEPEKATGAAIVVCPGGGFSILSYVGEGTLVAQELCKRGITAFVLKYRTTPVTDESGKVSDNPQDLVKIMGWINETIQNATKGLTQACLDLEYSHLAFEDADRAMTLVRQNASKWNINPDKIGIMGFSAGAVTTMHQALSHSEQSKPNFIGVIYGGWTPDVAAPADAAPMFICAPVNDVFQPDESIDVYKAWRSAKAPVELHYYSVSAHGYGAVPTGKSSDLWVEEMYRFMQDVEFTK
ncbi:MAG: alpha/beta hydrolase fold domain-containing protein [Bacteroidales bacterium]|nr:alpha/beta hydrolase fold domain-containing protein [Bacteroidales bacterium]